ncbi:uncharacterized protein LOC124912180 isoform X2 [Impatiens glandulifera]|uniref:uncharacterized protein LOC124912180 isoform X2 n=1 Tax=Impatiens glandulifera TaxID=253017 RepID=UPI001FB0B307|nr:uncharacterized protein LOC124912180 isoform X2 [Impatiens glandulifera]
MASTVGLVPITRAYLASYYEKYPLSPLPHDVFRLTAQIRSMSNHFSKDYLPLTQEESILLHEADKQPPVIIDENFWKNREQIEEIIFLLEQSPLLDDEFGIVLGRWKSKFEKTLEKLKSSQIRSSEIVFNSVMKYMPQDIRGALIRIQRDRSERKKEAEVKALVHSGGTIHQRYSLLWKQQMDRRQQLAQLGSATGAYKIIVKYLVGVPQVLLDFVRQINDVDGPMVELQRRYGPPLYSLTTMVLNIRLFLTLWWQRFGEKQLEVFADSPFFITAEAAGAKS